MKNEVRTQEALEEIAQRLREALLREGLPEELVQGEDANSALQRAAGLVVEGAYTEEELVSEIKDRWEKGEGREQRDIKDLIDSQEMVETQLKEFARRALIGEGIAEDINKLETRFPPFLFLKFIMIKDKEEINAQFLKEEGVPEEYVPLFIRWRNQYDILSNSFRRARRLDQNRENSWEEVDHSVLYDSERSIPQVEVRVYDQEARQIFYTRDDVDDILKLARAFLVTANATLRGNMERRIDPGCVNEIRKAIATIGPILEEIKGGLKVFEEREE